MKKLLLLVVAVAMGATFANAQDVSFGPKVGLNYAGVMTNDPDASGSAVIAPAFGAFAEISFGKLSVQPELLYSMQGVKSTDPESGDVLATTKLNYLNIPVMVKYNIAAGLNIQAGPQIGINTSAKIDPNYSDIEVALAKEFGMELPESFKIIDANPIDFGFNVGLGYEISKIVIDARANIGLTSTIRELSEEELAEAATSEEPIFMLGGVLENGDTFSMKNLNFQLSVGYKLF